MKNEENPNFMTLGRPGCSQREKLRIYERLRRPSEALNRTKMCTAPYCGTYYKRV